MRGPSARKAPEFVRGRGYHGPMQEPDVRPVEVALAATRTALGLKGPAPKLSADLIDELLGLAAAAAHLGDRRLAPLTTYLAGFQAGRADADEGAAALALLRDLRVRLEAPPGS